MATVPGILYIAEYHGQGGEAGLSAGVDGLNATVLTNLIDREVMRIVPDNGTTGASTADDDDCWPWYDWSAGDTIYTVGSSSTTTITVSPSPVWTVNEWAGRLLSIRNTSPLAGIGYSTRVAVVSNTADTLTFAALGGAPTVGATFHLGQGRFRDYHAAAGYIHAGTAAEVSAGSVRGGSSAMTAGLGIGPDARAIRKLLEDVYDEAPFFHFWKYTGTATVNYGWADSPNDAARAGFLAEKTRVDAAATARSNTIDWRYIVVDQSTRDLIAASLGDLTTIVNYAARLIQMIEWLRGSSVLNNADIGIVLVLHRLDTWPISAPGAVAFFNAVHREVLRSTPNVALIDMRNADVGTGVNVPQDEGKYYSLPAYLRDYGGGMAAAIARLEAGVPDPSETNGGLPVYLLIGDSIAVGEIELAWTVAANSTELSGPSPDTLERPSNQLIWSGTGGVLEVYFPHTNSNTIGTVSGFAGPELSLMAELSNIHPNGFALLKVAANSSGLVAADTFSGGESGRWDPAYDEQYPVLQQAFADMVQYVNDTLGKQVDVRGCVVSLGHNDQANDGGAEFADALPGFCDALWRDFGTRTSGAKFPIAWRRPQTEAANVDEDEMDLVREALADMQEQEEQFLYIDVDDLERDNDDNLHETPESAVTHGRRAFQTLVRIAI